MFRLVCAAAAVLVGGRSGHSAEGGRARWPDYRRNLRPARLVRLGLRNQDRETVAGAERLAVGEGGHPVASGVPCAIDRRNIAEADIDPVLDGITLPSRMVARQDLRYLATRQVGCRRRPCQNPALGLLQIALLGHGGDACVDGLI